MKIFTREDIEVNKEVIFEVIRNGAVFIHPTDTIYGIGCNAKLAHPVKKVREIKERPDAPFSVIAPGKEWIRKHCVLGKEGEEWLEKLPGPYTLVLKHRDCIAKNVAPGLDTLGVRIPGHWFSKIVEELGFPIVTTSANKSGENFMTSIDDLDSDVAKDISFVIYEGEKHGCPSMIVDLTKGKAEIKKR